MKKALKRLLNGLRNNYFIVLLNNLHNLCRLFHILPIIPDGGKDMPIDMQAQTHLAAVLEWIGGCSAEQLAQVASAVGERAEDDDAIPGGTDIRLCSALRRAGRAADRFEEPQDVLMTRGGGQCPSC